MYRIVFGISEVRGLEDNDFKFIPSRSRVIITGKEPAGSAQASSAAADEARNTSQTEER